MPNQSAQFELLPKITASQKLKNARWLRIWIFVVVFFICLIGSLLYVWLRVPIYQATASVLTIAPAEIDQSQKQFNIERLAVHQKTLDGPQILQQTQQRINEQSEVQHVAIQKQALLGVPLLNKLRQRINEKTDRVISHEINIEELQSILSVQPVPETNIVELHAQGQNQEFLAAIVNAWVDVYQQARESVASQSKNNTIRALEDENKGLIIKIYSKRQELEQFRKLHGILSKDKADNQVVSRLSGLNSALNVANEEEVKAKAKLDAIKAAIAKGEPVLPPNEQQGQGLASLEERAQQLRELVKDLRRRYTPQYVALQPELNLIPEQLEQTETAIRKKQEEGKVAALSDAEREYATARQTTQEIHRQINEHKHEVTEFTAKFAEYEALSADLEQMEAFYRQNQSRLLEIEAKQTDRYPQLDVIERASLPSKPIWPHYWRDSGIALVGSFGMALIIILLYDYLMWRGPAADSIKMPDVQVLSVSDNLLLRSQREISKALLQQLPDPIFGQDKNLCLDSQEIRELTSQEVRLILDSAEPKAKQLVGLLLSGITLKEAMLMKAKNFDFVKNCIYINEEKNSRNVPLAPRLKAWLSQNDPIPLWEQDQDDSEEFSGIIAYAMADSGIIQSDTVDAEVIRHTYLMYLVKQGMRLADLEKIAGKMSAKVIAQYVRHSPPGPGLRAESISLIYPPLIKEYDDKNISA